MSPYEPHPTTFLAVREFECRRLLGGDDNLPPYERLGAPVKAGSQLRFCEHCLEWLTVPVRGREAA